MTSLRATLHSMSRGLSALLIAGLVAFVSVEVSAQPTTPLFTAPPGGTAADVRLAAKRAADKPYIARQRAVGIDLRQIQPQAGRNKLALSVDLFDGVALLADLDRVDIRSAQSYSWFGSVRGLPNSRATLTVVNGILAGNLIVLDDWNRVKGSYQIQSAGDGLYVLEEMNQLAYPADHPPGIDLHPPIPQVQLDRSSPRESLKDSGTVTIDVMVVYSNETASAAGSAIGAQIQAAIDSANTIYANSGVNARLRLVYSGPANYAHSGNFSTDLSRLTSTSDGYMDDVHALRDAYGADMVSLWVEGGQYCGIGWVGPHPSYAFTVVNRGCATGNMSFAHELGHNMGALHDPYVDAGNIPYAYGHGHINLVSRWRTVMSYNDLCAATAPNTGCSRIPYLSNPNRTYGGAVLGTAEAGTTPTSDNARVHNNVAATVAGFRPTVVGAACTYTLSPTTASPTAAGGTATVNVTTQSDCAWTAASNAAWLTISGATTGTGSGTITYATAANSGARAFGDANDRRQDAHRQPGARPATTRSPPASGSFTAAAGSANVTVTVPTGCAWTATSSVSWLTVTSGTSGNGNGTVGYAATANTGPTRSANLTVGGQTFMVTQANGCTYAASPTSVSAVAGSSSGSVALTAGAGCTWASSSSASWLTVTSGASGSGNGSVGYAIAANTGAARSATLTVGGKSITVSQAALVCTYAFAPTSASFTAATGSSSVTVTVPSGCTWTASSSASWLTVTSGTSGNGNGTVGFSAAANTGPSRSATLTIGGQTYAVSQANGCTYAASPTSVSAVSGSSSGSIALTAGTGCTWTASSGASWLTVTSGASGSGSGSVGFAIAANAGAARSATLTVGGKTVTVNQAALSCNYTFAPTSASFTAAAGSSSVGVTVPTGCTWTATSSASWLTVTSGTSGNGNGTVGFAAAANTGPARNANLTIGGQTYAVTQANGCTYIASPTSVSAAAGSGSGGIGVTAGTGCTWTASSSASWLTVTSGASGSGTGSVGYAIAANTGAARSATLTVGGKTVGLTQSAFVATVPPPTGSNVALASAGAVATASSSYSGSYAASSVVNGDRTGSNGYWNDQTPGAFPDWIQITFNGTKSIDQVTVYTLQDNYAAPVEPTETLTFSRFGITDFVVQGWDGSSWVNLGSAAANNLVKRTIAFQTFTTDRIRVAITGTKDGYWSRVTEVEAWGVSAPSMSINFASANAGAVASASSSYSGSYAASSVVNGDRTGSNGYWNDQTPGAFPDWIQITFNGTKSIDQVTVYTLQDNYAAPVEPTETLTFSRFGITDFVVQGWDGSSWVNLGSAAANNLVKRTIAFQTFTTDRIRVAITGTKDGYWSRVTEVEAWGN